MNLTVDPWIPAVREDGTHALFSLQDVFAQGHKVRDLAVKPHERIALMRLLLCITQAALDGPEDESAWENCEDLIQPRANDYLNKWAPAFELFGNGPRFLQVTGLQAGKAPEEGTRMTKLDLALATGNNATLFDNAAPQGRSVVPARTALNLLTFQCFSPGGRIGVAIWNGMETPGKGSSNHSPCTPSSMLHTLVLGRTLRATLWLNLLTRETVREAVPAAWGRPVWEHMASALTDHDAIRNATQTFLGRMVPLSRAILLQEGESFIILANGLDYPIFPAFREATATITRRKEELALLPASTARSLWRQLPAITVRRSAASDQIAGPLALAHRQPDRRITLWIGALVTKKAKIEDVIEGVYTLPAELFTDFGRTAYENGVKHAEHSEAALMQAVKAHGAHLKVASPPYNRARQHFWTRVEQSLSTLFDIAQTLTPPDQLAESPWGEAVRAAAMDSYEQVCMRQTPRQIQAFALGLQKLNLGFRRAQPTASKGKNHA